MSNSLAPFIKCGVIGHPISHSKSPLIHNYWIGHYGLLGKYEALDIAPEDLEEELKSLITQGYTGFNLTIPHKELVLNLCDEIDEAARAVGAVNTLHIRNGKIYGSNTDIFGFLENIRANAPDFDFKSGPAVILGAGGAARAVLHGLLQEDVPEIRVLNRTRDRAEALAASCSDPLRVKVFEWETRAQTLKDAHLLINSTALGMSGKSPLELDLSALTQEALINDIVYAPLYTDLLKNAQKHGNPVVTGIGMLLHQARPAFEQWFGVMPKVTDELAELILK